MQLTPKFLTYKVENSMLSSLVELDFQQLIICGDMIAIILKMKVYSMFMADYVKCI